MNFDPQLLLAARREWIRLGLTILFGIAGGVAVILQAGQLSLILNAVFIDGWSRSAVIPWMITLLAIVFARALLLWLGDSSAGLLAVQIKTHLRSQLARKVLNLGPVFVRGENSGELVNTAVQGVESLDAYFSQYLPQVVLAAVIPAVILAVVFPMDWISGLVLLLTAPLIPIFMLLIGRASESATRRQWQTLSRLSAYFLDTLQGLRELKLLGQSKNRAEKVRSAAENYRLTTMKVLRVTFLSALVLEMVGTISTAIIAVQIGLRLLYGRMEFVDAFFILLLAPDFYLPLRQLGLRFHAGAAGIQAAKRIFAILDAPDSLTITMESVLPRELDQISSISFEQVSYTYPGQTVPALENITFTVKQGEMIALVGATGAGKSTLVHLLMRFMLPETGRILVNGYPLEVIPLETWRKKISWVPQNPILFQGSLAENIALGKPDVAVEQVAAAAQAAHLDRFIGSLPQGYQTQIGEFGTRLSGGELQRLALARAFLMNAPVVVLDEPTAHLDPQSETWFEESFRQMRERHSLFVIAHRLSTVYQADRILVMDRGRIVESGHHRDLLASGGYYSRLLKFYAGGVA